MFLVAFLSVSQSGGTCDGFTGINEARLDALRKNWQRRQARLLKHKKMLKNLGKSPSAEGVSGSGVKQR